MPDRRLHLTADPQLGPVAWVREATSPGRSRAVDSAEELLATLTAGAANLAPALHRIFGDGRLRHRCEVLAKPGGSMRTVPCRPIHPDDAVALLTVLSTHLHSLSSHGTNTLDKTTPTALLADLATANTAARLDDELLAPPDLIAAALASHQAAAAVHKRLVRPVVEDVWTADSSANRARARWHATDLVPPDALTARLGQGPAQVLVDHLVDAHARRAVRSSQVPSPARPESPVRDSPSAEPLTHPTAKQTTESVLVRALTGPDPEFTIDLPRRRAIQTALDRFIASGRSSIQLLDSRRDLLVRLCEPRTAGGGGAGDGFDGFDGASSYVSSPPSGTRPSAGAGQPPGSAHRSHINPAATVWPLQTCVREEDGTVHPVADLLATHDLTASAASQAAGNILRLVPHLADATTDATGFTWLLSTNQASRFLTDDGPHLEARGVTVLLPREWTTVKATIRPQVEDAAASDEQREAAFGLASMVRFSFKTAIGDVELTDEELEQIRQSQADLVYLRGQWVRLDRSTVRAAERFMEAFRSGRRRPAYAAWPSKTGGIKAASADASASATSTDTGMFGSLIDGSAEGSGSSSLGSSLEGELTLQQYFALLASPEADGVAIAPITARGHLEALFSRVSAHNTSTGPRDQPQTLQAQLRPYQKRGLDWLSMLDDLGLGAILADDMGLGKTIQLIALLCREREHAQTPPGPTLLVCPMSVTGSWQRELARFAPHLTVHLHHGAARYHREEFTREASQHDITVTTYSLLARDLSDLTSVSWHRVVFDEAQHLKNHTTAVSRAARSLPQGRRIALTGTPVENRLADLRTILDVVNPGLLGSATAFEERIARPIEHDNDESALTRLKALTAPFILRREKSDRSIITDLPEKQEMTATATLTPEQAGLYEALVADMMRNVAEADDKRRRAVVVSTLTKLKQVCNHPAHYLDDGSALLRNGEHRSGKLDLLDDLMDTAFADGEKMLLFTQFRRFGDLLVPYWQERFAMTIPFLHGGLSKPDRDAMVEEFQRSPGPGAMLLSLRAGGTGLTLTAASQVVHIDRWWNPAVENQATDRAYRIGQTRTVQVRRLVCAGTIEERIDSVLADKAALAELSVGSGESWIANLDPSRLLDLFALDTAGGIG
ncbi:DEAD/DEAH box helicase [Devriesea agamarum]|uniref:DEAD/DEAH box helicase n=1 Tax=Devriesea agamarum TaxID=472569 RepID=UPI00071E3824|nr:DEAD/DEAH box helicase [Devriesea agamarum]